MGLAKIHRGENLIVRIRLKQQNGDALNLSDLVSLKAEIIQLEEVVDTYVIGTDPEIRQGNTANEVEIEITSELTESLSRHDVFARLTLEVANDELEVDENQIDITGMKIFTVV